MKAAALGNACYGYEKEHNIVQNNSEKYIEKLYRDEAKLCDNYYSNFI